MKKTWGALGAFALLALVGCGPHTLSGTYVGHDAGGAMLLQLTQNQEQHIMGSMSVVVLKPDGSLERREVSITDGTTDGQSFTLTLKPNELFGQTRNISGKVAGDGMDVTFGGAPEHLATASPQVFNDAVQALTAAGQAQQEAAQQAKATADAAKTIAALTQNLKAYNDRIQGNTQGPEVARNQEEKLVDAARKDLGLMQDLEAKHQEFPAGQVRFRIGQLAFQMGQVKFQVDQVLQQGSEHINTFDQALAKSPCFTHTEIQGCTALGTEKMRYVATRAKVESNLTTLAEDFKKNGGAMDAINKQAGN